MHIEQPYGDRPLHFEVWTPTLPLPTDAEHEGFKKKADQQFPNDADKAQELAHQLWLDAQTPPLASIPEIAWVYDNTPDAQVGWSPIGIDGNDIVVDVDFTRKSDAMLFKLTWGGDQPDHDE